MKPFESFILDVFNYDHALNFRNPAAEKSRRGYVVLWTTHSTTTIQNPEVSTLWWQHDKIIESKNPSWDGVYVKFSEDTERFTFVPVTWFNVRDDAHAFAKINNFPVLFIEKSENAS